MLQLAENQILQSVDESWQAVKDLQKGTLFYVSLYLAQKTQNALADVKHFVAQHGFPSQAATLLQEDARAQRHGWQLLAGGKIGPKARQRHFKIADDLFYYLAHNSAITRNVDEIVALYDNGASHLNALEESGRVALVQNASLVYVRPQVMWEQSALDYWRKHVVPGLRSTT